jgi:hypothetical protein
MSRKAIRIPATGEESSKLFAVMLTILRGTVVLGDGLGIGDACGAGDGWWGEGDGEGVGDAIGVGAELGGIVGLGLGRGASVIETAVFCPSVTLKLAPPSARTGLASVA